MLTIARSVLNDIALRTQIKIMFEPKFREAELWLKHSCSNVNA